MILEGYLIRVSEEYPDELIEKLFVPIGKEVTLEFGGPVVGKVVSWKYIKGEGIMVKVKLQKPLDLGTYKPISE